MTRTKLIATVTLGLGIALGSAAPATASPKFCDNQQEFVDSRSKGNIYKPACALVKSPMGGVPGTAPSPVGNGTKQQVHARSPR